MLNCIIIQGRFKADPELRYTHSNTAVCNVTLAVQRSRKDQSGEYPTDWIDCVFFGKAAEHVKTWFGKGDLAIVRGRLESRDWEDKNGNKRRSWEVQAESIDFCGGKKDKAKPNTAPEAERYTYPEKEPDGDFQDLPDDDSDIPF